MAEDVLLQFDGEVLNEAFDLTNALQQKKVGDTASITLIRGDRTLTRNIVFSATTQKSLIRRKKE